MTRAHGQVGQRNVRQDERFELEISGTDAQTAAEKEASSLLAKPVIEDFTIGVIGWISRGNGDASPRGERVVGGDQVHAAAAP